MKSNTIKQYIRQRAVFILIAVSIVCSVTGQQKHQWSKERAKKWYATKGWLRGSDFIPSTAINQLEMWQAETFDPATIDKELGYAESLGLNCMRVFLHHAAWQIDTAGFLTRVNRYLEIASSHHIVTMFVFFDDCWNDTYKTGLQPEPKPGIHNSGWVRDPGKLWYGEPKLVDTLKFYVRSVIRKFKHDKRILLWDLYNEPGNSKYESKSMDLLEKAFTWAREINPDQPLSSGVWNDRLNDLNRYQLMHSDIITYHDYHEVKEHQHTIDTLKHYGRPLICTEYMARSRNSTFFAIMPILKKNNIGAINWGLVSGKTNTRYAWDTPMPDGAEPKIWFHDIFQKDGTPYKKEETDFIKKLTSAR